MPNTGTATEIREALLTSPYVDEVLKVQLAGEPGAFSLVGIRVSITNVHDMAGLPPLIAELRGLTRGVVGEDVAVFVEPDLTEPNREDVSTESIVIRSWD